MFSQLNNVSYYGIMRTMITSMWKLTVIWVYATQIMHVSWPVDNLVPCSWLFHLYRHGLWHMWSYQTDTSSSSWPCNSSELVPVCSLSRSHQGCLHNCLLCHLFKYLYRVLIVLIYDKIFIRSKILKVLGLSQVKFL